MARGFTLVEILIVVVILGVLAAIVVPQGASATRDADFAAVERMFGSFESALVMYRMANGELPPDGLPSNMPAAMGAYIDIDAWNRARPLGGRWDWNGEGSGVLNESNLAINEGGADLTLWQAFDAYADDGDLDTGSYRQAGNHLAKPMR